MTQTNEYGVPVVEVALGGKSYRLAFDMAGIRRIVKTDGLGFDAFDKLAGPEVVDVIDGIVWAALASDAPELTREQVASCIHFGNFSRIVDAVNELILASFPDAAPLLQPADEQKAKGLRKSG